MILWDGETMHERTVVRLSWACGPVIRDGWHHSDIEWDPAMLGATFESTPPIDGEPSLHHVGPIQEGLPWPDATFDYVVSHHGLMMLPEVDLVPALVELRRVTKPGGWLRVSLPDIVEAIYAYLHGNRSWFPLEAEGVDDAFCRYVTQNGATRSVFTELRLLRLLRAAGWTRTERSNYEETFSPFPGITDLDSRPDESLYMEAMK